MGEVTNPCGTRRLVTMKLIDITSCSLLLRPGCLPERLVMSLAQRFDGPSSLEKLQDVF